MPTDEIIIRLFCMVDDQLGVVNKRSDAHLYSSEIVTLGNDSCYAQVPIIPCCILMPLLPETLWAGRPHLVTPKPSPRPQLGHLWIRRFHSILAQLGVP